MNLCDINPFVRYARQRTIFNEEAKYVMAYDYRLFYVYSGIFEFDVDGTAFKVTSNKILIVPPAVKYWFVPENNAKMAVVNFDMDFENSEYDVAVKPDKEENFDHSKIISKNIYNNEPMMLSCGEKALEQINEMIDLFISHDMNFREKMACLLKSIITYSISNNNEVKTPELVKKVAKYIEENFSDNISNEDLHREFSYHPNYINHIFKKYKKMSIHEYIINYRLTKAAFLLNENPESISEIGYMCGFTSTSYFIKKFREKYGISPRKFKYNQI